MDPDDLAAIAAAVADELARRGQQASKLADDRLAYSEREAAAALGVPWYTLRNARLAGEISGRRLGRGHVYGRVELLAWLADGTKEAKPSRRHRKKE
jgi:hypothetical protein